MKFIWIEAGVEALTGGWLGSKASAQKPDPLLAYHPEDEIHNRRVRAERAADYKTARNNGNIVFVRSPATGP